MSHKILILFIVLIASCQQPADQNLQIEQLEAELERQSTLLDSLEAIQNRSAVELVHIVYLTLKSSEDEDLRTEVVSEIQKLGNIDVVRDLSIGAFEDLGDPRALSEFELVFQMGFSSAGDYKIYQEHPIHLALKAKLGEYLDGPPVTYDYKLK